MQLYKTSITLPTLGVWRPLNQNRAFLCHKKRVKNVKENLTFQPNWNQAVDVWRSTTFALFLPYKPHKQTKIELHYYPYTFSLRAKWIRRRKRRGGGRKGWWWFRQLWRRDLKVNKLRWLLRKRCTLVKAEGLSEEYISIWLYQWPSQIFLSKIKINFFIPPPQPL